MNSLENYLSVNPEVREALADRRPVVALDARTATISNAAETVKLPLSIFPEPEQRRIAAD